MLGGESHRDIYDVTWENSTITVLETVMERNFGIVLVIRSNVNAWCVCVCVYRILNLVKSAMITW